MKLLKDEEIIQALQKAGCLNITVTAIPLGQVIAQAQLDKVLKEQNEALQVQCPFCGEGDFDLIGLKYHLENYCEKYPDIRACEGISS